MKPFSEAYQKKRLHELLSNILDSEKAAGWVIERRMDKADELLRRYSDKTIALLGFDVDHIKDFVFGTSKPLEIQGASEMLKDLDLDRPILREVLQAEGLSTTNVLFAGGGTGLLVLPGGKAAAVSGRIQSRFNLDGGIKSCTVVHQKLTPYELVCGPGADTKHPVITFPGVGRIAAEKGHPIRFGQIMQLLGDRMREAKEEKMVFAYAPLPGVVRRCSSCGLEAAVVTDRIPSNDSESEKGAAAEGGDAPQAKDVRIYSQEGDPVCSHCLQKREAGRGERNRLKKSPMKTAQTINDIAGEDERGHYAVVYADANNMGSTFSELETMADYTLFSLAVTDVLKDAVKRLIEAHALKGHYQAPILGGDDLFFIVPAHKAARLSSDLVKEVRNGFRRKAADLEERDDLAQRLAGIGMSVGFVVVPAHFAIRYAADYAEALLRSAKKKARKLKTDCIDYLVIKDASPLNVSIEELRTSQLYRKTPEGDFKLTCKPFTLKEFDGMIADVENLDKANVPQSQLQQIESILKREPPKVASLLIRSQLPRVEAWRSFCELAELPSLEHLAFSHRMLFRPRMNVQRYRSAFLDLMELYGLREGR